jgi:hypothetical protein
VIDVPTNVTPEQLRDFIAKLLEARFSFIRRGEQEAGGFDNLSDIDKAITTALAYENFATQQMVRSIRFVDKGHDVETTIRRLGSTVP